MTVSKLDTFTKGWFIGNFDPSLNKTKEVEVSARSYTSGYVEPAHYHKVATEYTVILSGKYSLNDATYSEGDIITIFPNEVANFSCIESGKTVVVKIPSVAGDKYVLDAKEV